MPGETKTANDDSQRERLVYTYTYTSDDEAGDNPQSNTLKVITTVEEETTPDGTKVLRKKEESQQISKVTKVEKITRVHHHAIDPTTGEHLREDDPRYRTLIDQLTIKPATSGGFSPNLSSSFQPALPTKPNRNTGTDKTKLLEETMKRLGMDHDNQYDPRMFSKSQFNGNEPENNKSTVSIHFLFS